MKALRALLLVALCLMVQQGLAKIWPGSLRWIDLMLLPALVYALSGSMRTAMLIGCLSGLLQDAWFGAGIFGANGFQKTLVAYLVGSFAGRFDLNQAHGKFAAGFLAALLDTMIGLGLRRLLSLDQVEIEPIHWVVRAILVGTVVIVALGKRGRRLWLQTGN